MLKSPNENYPNVQDYRRRKKTDDWKEMMKNGLREQEYVNRWENKWENPLWNEREAKEDVKGGHKWRNVSVKHRRCWVQGQDPGVLTSGSEPHQCHKEIPLRSTYCHLQRGWKMSELFVVSMEKDTGVVGQRRNGQGGSLVLPPCWMCPRDQTWAAAAGASVFPWGAWGFLQNQGAQRQGCVAQWAGKI